MWPRPKIIGCASQMLLNTIEAQGKVQGALFIGSAGMPVTRPTGTHLMLHCLENRDTVVRVEKGQSSSARRGSGGDGRKWAERQAPHDPGTAKQ